MQKGPDLLGYNLLLLHQEHSRRPGEDGVSASNVNVHVHFSCRTLGLRQSILYLVHFAVYVLTTPVLVGVIQELFSRAAAAAAAGTAAVHEL